MSWKLAFRHLLRHWRLNLILLTVMVFGATLLAVMPMLAVTIAGESFSKTLESAPIHERNIIVQGSSRTDEPPDAIERSLGVLLREIMAVRESDIPGFTIVSKSDGTQFNFYPATLILNLRSFDRLDERTRVLDGRLPAPGRVSEIGEVPQIFEAVIGAEASHRSGLEVGDQVEPLGGNYHLRIVGIVEPLHPDAEIWWGDRRMTSFSTWRRISISPDIDEWNIPLIVDPKTMITKTDHNQYWRIVLDHEKISTSIAPAIRQILIGLQSSLSEDGLTLSTGLIDRIAQFEEEFALAQVTLVLLTFQSLVAVFYLLGMFGNFLVEQSQRELATLSGRGFSRAQIAGLFARAAGLLAILAGSVAPLIAYSLLGAWSNWQNHPAPKIIPVESWWLALSTGLFSWIFLVTSVYRATRPDLLLGQGAGLRYDHHAQPKRHIIWDVFILTLGGLAYWQLTAGSKITHQLENLGGGSLAVISDMVLLLGPFLLLLAIALILVRLFPFLWRSFSWISHQGRGLSWNLVFTRLARQPVGPSQVTILISLTAGLTIFASVFAYSIENWQRNMARYLVGADIRLSQHSIDPAEEINLPELSGLIGTTQVIRTDATFLVNEYQRLDFDLLAVDPEKFPAVVAFPRGISAFSMDAIMGVLHTDSPDVLPIIISSNAQTLNLEIGDQITMELGTETYPFEIVGIIVNFPLLKDVYAITDLSKLTQKIDLETMVLSNKGAREIWLAVEPGQHQAVFTGLRDAGLEGLIVGYSQAQLDIFRNNLVFREVTTAFGLNALMMVPLSVMGFFLILFLSAHRRMAEFYIYQAMGLSKSQRRGLLVREGLMIISLGLLIGIGIGIGLLVLMQPFLSQILPPISGGFVLNQILVNWSDIAVRFLALIVLYGIVLFFVVTSTLRNHRSTQF